MRRLHLYTVTLTVQLIFGFEIYVKFPAYRYLFVEEDQLVENLTAVFYLTSVVLAVWLFTRDRRSDTRMILLIPALIGLVGFLDELSWGETIFGLSMPVIAGDKINGLHDFIDLVLEIYSRQYTVVRVALFLGSVVGVGIVGFPYREKIFRTISLVPRQPFYFAWTLFTVLAAVAVFLDQGFHVVGYATFFEEMLEMNAAFVLILATLETHKASLPIWDATPRLRGHSVHYNEVVTMKLVRLIVWAAVAITSVTLGIAISGPSGNTTETALVFVIATLAVGRTAKISFQSPRSKLVNKGEVARFFGVSKRTIDVWVADGKLPKPRRRFGLRRWEYEKIKALRK
jgi:predicted DNA-binding transcriptional regulator AlpA